MLLDSVDTQREKLNVWYSVTLDEYYCLLTLF